MWFSGESHVTTSFNTSKWWDVIQLWFRSSAASNWSNLSACYRASIGIFPSRDVDMTCFFNTTEKFSYILKIVIRNKFME